MNCKHELFGVQHWGPLVLAFFTPLTVTPSLLALAPKVGTAVHAGNVENGDALQRDAAEVQSYAITLLRRGYRNGWLVFSPKVSAKFIQKMVPDVTIEN